MISLLVGLSNCVYELNPSTEIHGSSMRTSILFVAGIASVIGMHVSSAAVAQDPTRTLITNVRIFDGKSTALSAPWTKCSRLFDSPVVQH
jgi:hypothetical protein